MPQINSATHYRLHKPPLMSLTIFHKSIEFRDSILPVFLLDSYGSLYSLAYGSAGVTSAVWCDAYYTNTNHSTYLHSIVILMTFNLSVKLRGIFKISIQKYIFLGLLLLVTFSILLLDDKYGHSQPTHKMKMRCTECGALFSGMIGLQNNTELE